MGYRYRKSACQIETFSRGALNGPVSVNLFRDTPCIEKRNSYTRKLPASYRGHSLVMPRDGL